MKHLVNIPEKVPRERRTGVDRRQKVDRRSGVRWEPDKNDRRRYPRRRKSDRDIWDHVHEHDD